MIYLVATLTIKPGSLPNFIDAAKTCIEATRREAGCISYDLHQSQTDENTLVFVERWENQESLDGHFNAPHFAVWREAGGPYFTSRKIEIIEVDADKVKVIS
ncbi:MAG: antibiotic biosynthesis monooxygenase [Rhizobiaceae bacterium]|nr:antibiotic biosynthesis monooxygenase [Rhizobiaceae bacterium]